MPNRRDLLTQNMLLSPRSVDPDDPKAIRRLQFNLQVAAGIQNWLADLVGEGRNVEDALRAVERAV